MNKHIIFSILLALVAISRGDRHLGYSSRHTQVPVPATTLIYCRYSM